MGEGWAVLAGIDRMPLATSHIFWINSARNCYLTGNYAETVTMYEV